RRINRVRAPPPAGLGTPPEPAGISDFAVVEGLPAIVSVMTVISDSGAIVQQAGTEPLVAAVRFLNEEVAARFNREYQFANSNFNLARTGGTDRASLPIMNNEGRIVAFFDWEPNRPGLAMLRQTGPALAAAFAVAAILVFLLLRQLHRSSAMLEAGRRHAEHQAAHDRLTGLPNRMGFDVHLARVLTDRETMNANLSLLMLDLDRFKQVNDTLGHQAGDQLICTVGKRIRAVVGQEMMIARLGGDEFAILVVSSSSAPDVTVLAANIIEAINQP